MFETIKVNLIGVAPLLMHNGQLADPLNAHAKAMKKLSAKRKKTDADYAEMARTEWFGSLYVNADGAPCVTGDMVEAFVKEGAKKSKLGKAVSAGLFADADSFALKYTGPKDVTELWDHGGFRDTRGVKVQRAKVQRTRPIFRDWSVEIELQYNPEVVEHNQIVKAMTDAGQLVGLGDYRPRFGRCMVEVAG